MSFLIIILVCKIDFIDNLSLNRRLTQRPDRVAETSCLGLRAVFDAESRNDHGAWCLLLDASQPVFCIDPPLRRLIFRCSLLSLHVAAMNQNEFEEMADLVKWSAFVKLLAWHSSLSRKVLRSFVSEALSDSLRR